MEKKTCFVIMPFSATTEKHTSEYWNEFFGVIKTEMESNDYTCSRSEVGPYSIMRQVIEKIYESDLVIAVLTDMNPNVWYELGIRHSLKNGTLMLLEASQTPPFDISSYGLIKYQDGISQGTKLKKEIHAYISKLCDAKNTDSPVLDILGFSSQNRNKIDEMYKLIIKMASEMAGKLPAVTATRNKHNRVLWVDDFPSNNQRIIDLFESKSVRFDIALSTQQGIKLVNEHEYDLVITDMGRGKEYDAGINLIRQIKNTPGKNTIPILVFASTMALQNYGKYALELGAVAIADSLGTAITLISNILGLE